MEISAIINLKYIIHFQPKLKAIVYKKRALSKEPTSSQSLDSPLVKLLNSSFTGGRDTEYKVKVEYLNTATTDPNLHI